MPVIVADHDSESGRVRVVRMNRPAARNAMNSEMLEALIAALSDAAGDPEVGGVLITGASRTFSAGSDVHEQLADQGRRRTELFTVLYDLLSNHPKPTAAAVEGSAIGGGAEVAASCDLRTAGRSAVFRFPGASYGVAVGAARTIGLVGLGTAKDWVLSCRDVHAEEALRTGLVQRVVADGEAESTALDWLALVIARDAATVSRLKKTMNSFAGLPDRVAWENDTLLADRESVPRSGAFGIPRSVQSLE
ncbi:MAG: enoyl-CoA hydratase/isomerase family protein [Nitriliruptorales bacterium]